MWIHTRHILCSAYQWYITGWLLSWSTTRFTCNRTQSLHMNKMLFTVEDVLFILLSWEVIRWCKIFHKYQIWLSPSNMRQKLKGEGALSHLHSISLQAAPQKNEIRRIHTQMSANKIILVSLHQWAKSAGQNCLKQNLLSYKCSQLAFEAFNSF